MTVDPIRRGGLAQEILNNELWDEAFAGLKEAYLVEAMKAGAKDDLLRFRCLEAIRQIETVRGHFQAVLMQGEEAKITLAEPKPEGFLRRVF